VNNVAPTADAGPDLFIFAGIVPIQFTGVGFDTPSDEPYFTYHWDFDDGTTSDLRNPIHYYTGDGTYTVTLTVTDDDGAIGQDTATIEVYIDSDGDGMPDSWEIKHNLDPNDPTGENGAQGDPDTDDLYNIYEFWADTDPRDRDTDDDSYYSSWEKINYWNFEDGPEVWYWMAHNYSLIEAGQRANNSDTDGDDLPDGWEEWWGDGRHPGSPIDPDDDVGHAGHDGDPDGDGMINYHEYLYDCNPLDPDTDHDGLPDGVEDKNSNGHWDCYPGVDYNGGNETHAHLPDTDYDGLLDGQEDINKNGTKEFNEPDPTDPDTDDDGILDGNHNHIYVIKIKSIEKLGGGFGNFHIMINDEGLLPYNGYRVPESGDWSVAPSITFSTPEIVAVAFYIDSLPIEVMDNSGTNVGGVLTLTTNTESSEIILSNGEVKLTFSCEKEEYGFHDPNPVFPDADFDNITDMPEAIYFSGRCRDFRVNDSDGDNLGRVLNDGYIMCNNLVDSDSDGDGILDGDEINSLFPTDPMREDSDDDGRVDPWELDNLIRGRPTNPDNDTYHNAIDSDSDDDGLKDGPEYEYWFNRDDGISWDYDSDNDGYINILDQDSDNDTLYDGVEITEYDISVTIASSTTVRTVSSDPAIADTDSDGYGDYEERYAGEDSFITDPTDPDTDDDGLLDSGEQYITSYETDTRYSIPDHKNSKAGKVDIELSNVKSSAPESRIFHVEARIGISHSCVSDLKLTLDNGVRSIVIRNFLGGGEYVHEDYDLIAAGFPASDLTTERTWKLKVEDHDDDDVGNIESFEIHIYVRTDPKHDDQDSDGLNDSEEVTLGAYGWLTEPYVADTDGDTLTDGDEVLGTTKGVPTNPTNPDTDADGYNDKEDRYPLHNVGVKVTLLYMIIDSGMDDSDHQPVEPQAVVTIDGKTFCTHIGLGTYFTIYYHYTVDVLEKHGKMMVSMTIASWM
jgi:PKD repeat protein